MDEDLKQQQQLYDETWRWGLESGKEERGNLQTNLEFLAQIAFRSDHLQDHHSRTNNLYPNLELNEQS